MEKEESKLGFRDMGLDERILEAIANLKWKEPTLIQEKAIPLALEGKDILARARTGSGKTAAFLIPIIHQILRRKSDERAITVLILAPSKELCKQIHQNVLALTAYCSREVSCVNVGPNVDFAAQRPLLLEKPDIVVGTPSRVLVHLKRGNLEVSTTLKTLVIDEADLMLSFGCNDEVHAILPHLSGIYQSFLMSATLPDKVKTMKKLVLHNPVILKLEEPELPHCDQLSQYHVKCEEEDKFVLIYAMLKLGLVRGKTLIFVKSVDRCFRLKLYLEQFGISSCVLNSEMPAASRCHAVTQFNQGVYNIVVASDEQVADNPGKLIGRKKRKNKAGDVSTSTSTGTDKPGPSKRKLQKDKDYSIARGIDFQFVANVINFDFPPSVKAYIHRVGRTARGNAQGTALSFVSMKEMPLLKEVENYLTDDTGKSNFNFKPYLFDMSELEGFKYRARDAFRAVTSIAIREARLKEIKTEILNSSKLKPYFEDNPRDLQVLRHDKALHVVKLDGHLKHVPDYIVPSMMKVSKAFECERKHQQPKTDKHERKPRRKSRKKPNDPLKTFHFEGLCEFENKRKKK